MAVLPAVRSTTSEAEPEEASTLAKYDLTSKLTVYLDKHLVIAMLNFLQAVELKAKDGKTIRMYKKNDVVAAQLKVLQDTYMLDLVGDKCKELGQPEMENCQGKCRDEIIKEVTEAQEKVTPLLEIFESEAELAEMQQIKTLREICAHWDLDEDIFDRLLEYAKLQYECGNYEVSKIVLSHYRAQVLKCADAASDAHRSTIWGLLASQILHQDYDEAAETILKLSDNLDPVKDKQKDLLVQRTWLLHWSLFVIFQATSTASSALAKLLDWFFDEKNLSIISLSCPHLFRYVGACLILNSKRLKHLLNSTVWVLQNENYSYSDPVTRFLRALYMDIDFDEAQVQLQRCRMLCKGDFFLARWWDDFFEENARLLIFESYCRIHQVVNIDMIASKLNMEPQDAELWIVKLIQNAKLEARIDSAKRRVVMSKVPPSVYSQVIEKTKNLCFRSTMLLSNLEKREAEKFAGMRG